MNRWHNTTDFDGKSMDCRYIENKIVECIDKQIKVYLDGNGAELSHYKKVRDGFAFLQSERNTWIELDCFRFVYLQEWEDSLKGFEKVYFVCLTDIRPEI